MADRDLSNPLEDPERTAIMIGVGECLSAWSGVEHAVASLFGAIVHGMDPNQVFSMFAAVVSFDARLDIVGALMEREQDEALKTAWNALKNKLEKLYKKRHQVAHFSIPWYPEESTHRLIPFLALGKVGLSPLSSNDLMTRADSFHRVAERVTRIAAYVQYRRGRWQGNPPPEGDPSQWLRNPGADDQTPRETQPRDQSSPV